MNTNLVISTISGTEIPHAHIHLIPRFENDGHENFINLNLIKQIPKEGMKEIANKIKRGFL